MRAAFGLLLLAVGLTTFSSYAWGKIGLDAVSRWRGPIIAFADSSFQVRVEQRIIIRIPRQTAMPVGMSNRLNSKSSPVRFKEQKIGKCLMMNKLVGSRPGPKESLDIATRDGALIRAYLGDGCLAREFYAGAYMERPLDGKLCIDRDLLHARTGAKCEIDKFRLLVPR